MNPVISATRGWGLFYFVTVFLLDPSEVKDQDTLLVLFLLSLVMLFATRLYLRFTRFRWYTPLWASLLVAGLAGDVPYLAVAAIPSTWPLIALLLSEMHRKPSRWKVVLYWLVAIPLNYSLAILLIGTESYLTEVVQEALLWTAFWRWVGKIVERNIDDVTDTGGALARELMATELAAHLKAGLTLPEAFRAVRDVFKSNLSFRRYDKRLQMETIELGLLEGDSLPAALRRAKVFPTFWVRVLDVAGMGEALAVALEKLAHLERVRKPMFPLRILVTLAVVLLSAALVLGSLMQSFHEMIAAQVEVLSTFLRVSIFIQEIATELPVLRISLLLIAILLSFPDFRRRLVTAVASRVFPSNLSQISQRANLYQTMAGLVELKLPTTAALEVASQALEERRHRDALQRAALRGADLTQLTEDFPELFPPRARFLILAGERTGRLVEGLRAAAELQEEELRISQIRARARVEVIATVGTALLVLSLAAMVFIPYLDIFHLSYGDGGFLPP